MSSAENANVATTVSGVFDHLARESLSFGSVHLCEIQGTRGSLALIAASFCGHVLAATRPIRALAERGVADANGAIGRLLASGGSD